MSETEKLQKEVKKSQELLGKHIKRPTLTDKNLSRPPFRFIHDIVSSVIENTGLLDGAFTPEELDSSNMTTREIKTAYLQKLISAISEINGETVDVKVSKILAGQEPIKTNQFLQSLAKACDKAGKKETLDTETAKVKKTGSGDNLPKTGSTTKATASKSKSNESTKGKSPRQTGPISNNKQPAKGSTSSNATKPSHSTGAKQPAANKGTVKTAASNNKKDTGLKSQQSLDEKKATVNKQGKRTGAGDTLETVKENPVTTDADEIAEVDSRRGSVGIVAVEQPSSINSIIDDQPVDKDTSSSNTHIDSNQQADEPRSLERKLSNSSSNEPGNRSFSAIKDGGTDSFPSGQHHKIEGKPPLPPQYSVRPDSGIGGRAPSARPMSARKAPPRPRTALLREVEEQPSNYRPPTGKVTNVLLDKEDEQDDDDSYIVREMNNTSAASKAPGLGDVDETPELALGLNDGVDVESLPADQRGLLVSQILETQKELEESTMTALNGLHKDKGKDGPQSKSKETSQEEIEKLKMLIQATARSANPLGKLLDFITEDVDAMSRELTRWREESRQLDHDLENAHKETERSLQPMKLRLKQLDSKIQDKEDAIAATKMTLIRQEERIQKILFGLDRVKSSHGRISDLLPSPEQVVKLMTEDTKLNDDDFTNRDFLLNIPDEKEFSLEPKNNEDNELTTEFSFASKSKPISNLNDKDEHEESTFVSSTDRPLVDVDDFNPWAD